MGRIQIDDVYTICELHLQNTHLIARTIKLSWHFLQNLCSLLQVINETLRLASVTPGLIRRALKDIQVNGNMLKLC